MMLRSFVTVAPQINITAHPTTILDWIENALIDITTVVSYINRQVSNRHHNDIAQRRAYHGSSGHNLRILTQRQIRESRRFGCL